MSRRFLALLALLAVFAGAGRSLASTVLYRCAMSGEVRAACCCEEAGIADSGCCEVISADDDATEATVVPVAPSPEATVLVALPRPLAMPSPPPVIAILDRPGAPRGPPRALGPPIYDRVCSWLI